MNTELDLSGGSYAVSGDAVSDGRTDTRVSALIDAIDGTSFEDWYRECEFARNIREGQPYFNGPDRIPPPERHSPSQLNQCHRKIYYRQLNAPEEQADPQGIFWTGTNFEEELVMPYLEATVGPNEYVRNSMWIDITCETDAGEVRIKGATDPVVVNVESEPLLLTESKTKQSLNYLDEPNTHHKAQVHAYMYGLTHKYDRRVTDAVLLYGSRTSLDVRAFHVPFDPWFWRQTVLKWAGEHTQYRLDETLPPATPEFGWECEFCSYRGRCGRSDAPFEDLGPTGLLPLTEYPLEKLTMYLEAYSGTKLTPTTANQHPELLDRYDVYDWRCQRCATEFPHQTIEWDCDISGPPLCPSCRNNGIPAPLSGPVPEDQSLDGASDDGQ